MGGHMGRILFTYFHIKGERHISYYIVAYRHISSHIITYRHDVPCQYVTFPWYEVLVLLYIRLSTFYPVSTYNRFLTSFLLLYLLGKIKIKNISFQVALSPKGQSHYGLLLHLTCHSIRKKKK